MTDIPEDIMARAREACEGFFPDPVTRATAEACAARAIMEAEARGEARGMERAARWIETYDPSFSATNSMLDDIATAIRAGGKT